MKIEEVNMSVDHVIAAHARTLLREALRAEEAAVQAYKEAVYEYPKSTDEGVIASREVVEAAIELIYQIKKRDERCFSPVIS
jgi:hypothetical protein